jgi:hypothetical protein
MWTIMKDGSTRNTGQGFHDKQSPATHQLIEEFDPVTGQRKWVAVNTRNPTERIDIGSKAPPPSLITGGFAAELAKSKLVSGVETAERSMGNVLSTIDSALPMVDYWTSGLMGRATKDVAGTPALNLREAILTIKSNIGFDRLQQMRRDSPTGGALGNVAVPELEALQKSIASLDQSQTPEQLRSNLRIVRQAYIEAIAAMGRAAKMEADILMRQSQYGNPQPIGATPAGPTQGGWQINQNAPQQKSAQDYLNDVEGGN